MTTTYSDLPTLKAWLSISATDTTRDTSLTSALNSASRRVDTYCGRRFYLDGSASQRIYDPDRRIADRDYIGQVLILDDIGDPTGMVCELGDMSGTSWTAFTDYEVSPINAIALSRPITGLTKIYGWIMGPTTRLRVTAKWGWPAVPDPVVEATLILAARLYRRKDSPEGVDGNNQWGAVRISRTDPDVVDLLGPYVLPGFG